MEDIKVLGRNPPVRGKRLATPHSFSSLIQTTGGAKKRRRKSEAAEPWRGEADLSLS